ncbi:hypothetical protein LCGC14_0344420 [marine sediment metagenome]|uniref:Uncharacterized protein n=1 Tax=marine sediment metagenome TaxID=412755 RepID=A0A0F9VZX9_9ZZZZ
MSTLWDNEEIEVSNHLDVPYWVEQDITAGTVAAVIQGGCASGAYMPAVTYYDAGNTMGEYGDDVLDYIHDVGFVLEFDSSEDSWLGFACKALSMAVELWAYSIEDELTDAIEEMLEDNDG